MCVLLTIIVKRNLDFRNKFFAVEEIKKRTVDVSRE